MAKRRFVSIYYLPAICGELGDTEKAFDLLEKSFEKRTGLPNLRNDGIFDKPCPDPRFKSMIKRMNLPE
jgi:hypothetical protein